MLMFPIQDSISTTATSCYRPVHINIHVFIYIPVCLYTINIINYFQTNEKYVGFQHIVMLELLKDAGSVSYFAVHYVK